MKSNDFDDLDDIIAELEDSLGVDSASYLEEDDDGFEDFGFADDESVYDLDEYDEEEDEDFDGELATVYGAYDDEL